MKPKPSEETVLIPKCVALDESDEEPLMPTVPKNQKKVIKRGTLAVKFLSDEKLYRNAIELGFRKRTVRSFPLAPGDRQLLYAYIAKSG